MRGLLDKCRDCSDLPLCDDFGRNYFAQLPLTKIMAVQPGRFSPNLETGIHIEA
jgi:hypothetical protein